MMRDDEWQTRTLCDDGACTGVIGADGTCRVCGRAAAYWGDERRRGQEVERDHAGNPAEPSDGEADGVFAERELCDDGACTGVLGEDGACRTCGRRPAGRAAAAVVVTPPTLVVAGADDDDEDDDRRLCPDGGCVGLLDARGVCKVCGRVDVGN